MAEGEDIWSLCSCYGLLYHGCGWTMDRLGVNGYKIKIKDKIRHVGLQQLKGF